MSNYKTVALDEARKVQGYSRENGCLARNYLAVRLADEDFDEISTLLCSSCRYRIFRRFTRLYSYTYGVRCAFQGYAPRHRGDAKGEK